MKYLTQFFIIMAFVLAGEVVYALVPLPIPASIWGMILLLMALMTGLVKLKQIENVANFFLIILPLLLVAPAVGVMDVFGRISTIWSQILTVAVIATLVTMVVVALLADKLIEDKK